MQPFPLDLTPGDFDAYHPERASSNAYSRPRLEFKQRALGWARQVVERLESSGIATDVHASDEHPSVRNGHRVDCQWVFFWRAHSERVELDALLHQRGGIAKILRDLSPYNRHAFLALRLNSEEVSVCAQVHSDAWIDFEAFRARLNDETAAAGFIDLIASLPDQFECGIPGRSAAPVSEINAQSLKRTIDQLGNESAALWVGWTIPRDIALEHADLLDEQLADALVALAPLYRYFSWREDDDPSGLKDTLDKMRKDLSLAASDREEADRKAQQERARIREEQTGRSRERTKERVDYDAAWPRPTLGNLFKPGTAAAATQTPKALGREPKFPGPQSPDPQSPDPQSPDPQSPDPQSPDPQFPEPPAAMPHGKRRRPTHKSRDAAKTSPPDVVSRPRHPHPATPSYVAGGIVDKGAKVRVLSGPFAGKVGVVGEIDGRGGARVLLGLLSTHLLAAQLEAVVEAKDRPALQSSHRRNGLLGRSGK